MTDGRYLGPPRLRSPRAVVDEIDRLLASDEEVPIGLATELLIAMTPADRARWLRIAVEHAWRPEPWPDDA